MADVLITPILYSDICGTKPSIGDLIEIVRTPEWRLVPSRCIGIAALSWQHGIEDPEHQYRLFRDFGVRLLYGAALDSRLRKNSQQRLYTRESLLAVLRIAVVNKTDPGTILSDLEFADVFHKAVLMANELIADELNPEVVTNGPKDFLATELRSILAQQQNPHDLIARTNALFEWNETPRAAAHGGVLPLRSDFEQVTGLSPEEFAAATYLALSRAAAMITWDNFALHGPAFNPNDWLQSQGVVNKAPMISWYKRHTVSLAKARSDWTSETSLSFAGAGPLWKKPMVEDDDGLLFMPSPFFVANMLGDGAYFELFDGYGDRNTQFSTLYGHFFQDYIEDRFRSGYEGRPEVAIWADVPYPGGDSSDVIISEAGHVIFIEVVAKRMQLVGSVLRLDEKAIADDLRLGVIEKLEQLRDNIAAFRKGTLLPEIDRVPGQRIYPVLVAPREWPRIYLLLHLLKEAPYAELFVDCEPVEFLDVGEVESLEARLQLGMRLAELLDRKNKSTPQNRALSLHNYLTVVEPGTYPIRTTPIREKGGDLAKKLMEIATSWGNQSPTVPDEGSGAGAPPNA